MKVAIAVIVAGGLLASSVLWYRVSSVAEEMAELETSVLESSASEASSDVDPYEARWAELDRRLEQIERKAASAPAVASNDVTDSAIADVRDQLATNATEIAALRADLDSARKVRGFLDQTADRVLAAAGEEGGEETDGRRGGMARLAEIGSLFGKRPEDMTDEELQKRADLTAQFRQRQTDWLIRGFDRSLEVRLTEDQKTLMGDLLAEENASMDELRQQDLDDEQRSTARAEIRKRTDDAATEVLGTDQHEAWTKYRANRRGFGSRR